MKWGPYSFSSTLVLFLIAFAVLVLERAGFSNIFYNATWLLLKPGQNTGTQIQRVAQAISNQHRFIVQGGKLLAQLEFSLQKEKSEEDQLQILQKENALLREQLGDRTNTEYSTFALTGFREKWFIDGGCQDGVEKDAPVLFHNSLIGQVVETYETTSLVATLYDQSWRVPVAVGTGSARALLNTSQGTPLLAELSFPVQVGDVVSTAGVAGLPGGVTIGRISQVNEISEQGVLQSAFLEPYFLPLQASFVQLPVKEGSTCEAV